MNKIYEFFENFLNFLFSGCGMWGCVWCGLNFCGGWGWMLVIFFLWFFFNSICIDLLCNIVLNVFSVERFDLSIELREVGVLIVLLFVVVFVVV